MARRAAKDAVVAHFAALFADDATVVVRGLRNLQNPEPPRSVADVETKAFVYLQFPPHTERPVAIGGPSTPWRESGVFLIYALVASATLDVKADAVFERATDSLRAQTIAGGVDVKTIFGAEAGARFDGNWWGLSCAVEYEFEDI
ncbi:MAG: hypothetical protein K2Q06_06100 [Parvularculaceae bacterium]|nr:hypothetical protein [Parvularculaceae bacterium]